MTPASTSRPRSSVPNAWARDGGDSGAATEAKGSVGASTLANSASATSARVRPRPTAPPEARSRTSLIADAWIQPRVCHVGDEVGADDGEGGQQEQAEEDRDVAGLDGREQELAKPRPREHRLHEDGAGHDQPGAAAH